MKSPDFLLRLHDMNVPGLQVRDNFAVVDDRAIGINSAAPVRFFINFIDSAFHTKAESRALCKNDFRF
jgi:hypothetical protein